MKNNPVGWFEIYVQDMQRAKRFYETVLQNQLTALIDHEPEMMAFPQNMNEHGAAGALVRMPGFPSGKNSTLIYFSCVDCAVEESRIEAAGGKVFKPKSSIGDYGFITLAFDTETNMFGLHSSR